MSSVLVVTLTRRLGGAERMIAQLLRGFRDQSRYTLGLVTSDGDRDGGGSHREGGGSPRGTDGADREAPAPGARRPGIPWNGPTVGLREILFGRYDVIHSHLFLPGLLVRLRRVWDGSFRWIHTVHYGEAAYGSMSLGRLRRWLDRAVVFPHADRVVAVSPSIAEEIGPAPHLRLIENAISLEPDAKGRGAHRGAPAPEEAAGSPGGRQAGGDTDKPSVGGRPVTRVGDPPVTLGTVARLRKEKGIDDLLGAVRILSDRGRRVSLRIAGDGKEAAALRKRTAALGLDDVVEFHGFVEEVDRFYRSLDVYVQPSHMESFGIAALESMRFSLPLVARSVGNLPRLLGEGEFGILVEAGPLSEPSAAPASDSEGRAADVPTALADAVERAMDDLEEYRARARRGLEHWRERYDPERMVRAHEELYREVTRPAVCMMAPIATQSTGGIQRQLLLQSRELARRGHRVFLVQRSDLTLESDPEQAERWRHVTVLGTGRLSGSRAGPGRILQRVRGLAFVGAGLLRLWQLRRRVQVLHAHQLHSPTLLGALGRRLLLKPLVTKVTSSGEMGEGSEVRRLPFTSVRLEALRTVDRILVLTPHMGVEVEGLGAPADRIRIVPNSVEIPDRPAVQPRPWDRNGPDGPFRILFVGRLSTEKCLEDLLAAAEVLAAEGWPVEVELVGGPDPDRNAEPGLREMCDRSPGAGTDRAPTVRFRGHRSDVARFYRAADAFVLPSSTEGLSNALLEAMAHGVPCVASDIPQNRFALGDAGLLFSMGSAEDLARTIRRLIRDRERGGDLIRRLSAAARKRAQKEFSLESVVDRLESVYDEVAG